MIWLELWEKEITPGSAAMVQQHISLEGAEQSNFPLIHDPTLKLFFRRVIRNFRLQGRPVLSSEGEMQT
jgi:hypothetical protein